MRILITVLKFGVLLYLLFCLTACGEQIATFDGKPTVILISIDGFGWDYPEKAETPNLDFLIQTGVRAQRMIPVFPSKTFPNHYTIVTGLYPEHHGIIANNMYDPVLDQKFDLSSDDAIHDSRWWSGEPIWVTAEKQELISACYFWPGSSTKIAGKLPSYYFEYDRETSDEARIEQVLRWLDLPVERRPALIVTYFATVDGVGHDFGPNSPEIVEAIQYIDGVIGLLINGLKERGIVDKVNIIIVSDHGMAEISAERVIFLDDYIDLADVDVIDWSPILALNPKPGKEEEIYNRLVRAHPHLKVYHKSEMPARFRYSKHPRIPAIIGIADEGWSVITHENFKSKPHYVTGGNHGFDNQLVSMGATFIARGPAFKSGLAVAPFQNIHLYNLMAEILRLKPAPNDGSLDSLRVVLR